MGAVYNVERRVDHLSGERDFHAIGGAFVLDLLSSDALGGPR
jgi:hypothetical protein